MTTPEPPLEPLSVHVVPARAPPPPPPPVFAVTAVGAEVVVTPPRPPFGFAVPPQSPAAPEVPVPE